jgi:hypothetical protein
MDIIPGVVIFILGFVFGAILSGTGAAVRIAKTEAAAHEAFRDGWWTGLQDARHSTTQTPQEPQAPVKSAPRKGLH